MSVSQILKYCQENGIHLVPSDNNRIKYSGPNRVVTKEFLTLLKQHKHEILSVLKILRTFNGISSGTEGNYKPILCPYKDEPRFIHPEVCKWHREENDPECKRSGCSRINLH